MNLRMPFMPVGMRLEGASRLNDGKVVTGSTPELQPNGKILIGESARNRHCRKTAEIADAIERIADNQSGCKIKSCGGSPIMLRRPCGTRSVIQTRQPQRMTLRQN